MPKKDTKTTAPSRTWEQGYALGFDHGYEAGWEMAERGLRGTLLAQLALLRRDLACGVCHEEGVDLLVHVQALIENAEVVGEEAEA